MTGRYPHRSGGEGFHHLRQPDLPIFPELLRQASYRVGILGKVTHSTPYSSFQWDMNHDMVELGMGRNPKVYYQHATTFIQDAKDRKQPFFLMANSHDPHRPFYGNDKTEWYTDQQQPPASVPSRVFSADDVEMPSFLPDLPQVRLEIAEYYSSVRRCDDTLGKLLDILEEMGVVDNTLVIFLSDNGMAFPFAKTNCYLHSTKTPWIMRWPEHIKPNSVDKDHFISSIDLLPTVLEATGLESPPDIDGFSFLPLLCNHQQERRDKVFTQFHQTAGRQNYPMRCVQTKQFGYIFNPWSNGQRIFKNESQSGRTMNAMRQASSEDQAIANRVQFFLYRVPEEFYHFQNDPDALHNLIDDPEHTEQIDNLRADLESWMQLTHDPALETFRNRYVRNALEEFINQTTIFLGNYE